ncbi:hypothetical protein BD779DRAFT_1613874 [Infundibulicybe gibba]|nr:hypothetical protein BD779DRAFT_1613874 [Infundibulicybe gibba]
MHLISLNLTDLLLSLWRGTLDCNAPDDRSTWDWAVLRGDVWRAHGKTVADATPYLPGSFDRPPRNPAEKISSGYKAWEYLLYIFALGPGIFYGVLPDKYWRHFCLLVMAVRILHQRRISRDQLLHAHELMLEFILNFELLYYQRKESRLHFCRPSIHALLHLAPEVARVGPGVYYTQWTMERTIGNLGEEIHQPSNPFANLSQRGVRRSQVNALKAMVPDLGSDNSDSLPHGAIDLGDGYVLLRAKDERAHTATGAQGAIIRSYLEQALGESAPGWNPRVIRWARLRLPNGQIARSAWKENLRAHRSLRMARNVKIAFDDGTLQYGEVQYFFRAFIRGFQKPLALVSLYSPPDMELLHQSHDTVWACRYQGMGSLHIIDVQSILSVVGMIPMPHHPVPNTRFVAEKLGLDVADLDVDHPDWDVQS